jgi:DNA primase catalytic core
MTLKKVIDLGRYLLQNCPEAEDVQAYLDTRVSRECQEKFEFGYFPPPFNLKLITSSIDEKELEKLGLLYIRNVHDSISARIEYDPYFTHQPLIMPYKDVYGNVIAIVGRSLLEDDERKTLKIEKYKNTKFKKNQHLFGLFEAKESIIQNDLVYVVEGQFDVIKAFERGITNIVALGSASMSDYQVSLILRYTKNILLLLDNDTAGDKGRALARTKYSDIANINDIYLPEGYKDIDDYLKDNDGDSLVFATKDSNIRY